MTRRRDLLRFSIAAGAGLVGAPVLAQAAPNAGEAGAVAEDFVFSEWLSAMDKAIAASGGRGDLAFWRAFTDGGAGLDRAASAKGPSLVSLPAPGVELLPPAQAREMAMLANDRLAAAVRGAKGRMFGLATLSATDRHAVREAERAIGRLGLSGLSLGANRGVRLDDRQLWPVYDFAQSTGVAVYLPASYAPSAGDAPYRAMGRPGILAGAAAESAAHANQLIFGGVFDAFPALKVVLSRLGEATPYWHSEIAQTHEGLRTANAAAPRRSVELYFAENILLTTADITSPETLAYCASIIGADRMLRSREQRIPTQIAAARLSMPRARGLLSA